MTFVESSKELPQEDIREATSRLYKDAIGKIRKLPEFSDQLFSDWSDGRVKNPLEFNSKGLEYSVSVETTTVEDMLRISRLGSQEEAISIHLEYDMGSYGARLLDNDKIKRGEVVRASLSYELNDRGRFNGIPIRDNQEAVEKVTKFIENI